MVSQIKAGAVLAYITIFINIVTGLLYTPWMIRQIGVSDYGLYTLISSFLSYFLLDFGLGTAVARYIAKYRAEGRSDEINKLVSLIVKVFAFIDLIIFLVIFILFFYIEDIFTGLTFEETSKFKIIYCIAGCFSLLSFPFSYINGVLVAHERFITLKMCDLLYRLLIVISMITCLLLGYGLYALVFVNGFVGFVIAVFKLCYIRINIGIKFKFKYFDTQFLKELLLFAGWVFLITIASRLMYNIIPTILGRYCNSTQVAIFSMAMMIEGYVYTFAGALNGLFLPRVTGIASRSNTGEELTKLMIRVGRIQLLIVGGIIIGFLLLGDLFIKSWLSEDFSDSYYVTVLLILPGLVSLIEEIGNTALIATNELKYRAFLFIGASIISITLGAFLSPLYGAIGCAIAVNISLIFCHVIGMNFLYKSKLDISVWLFFKETILKYLPAAVLPVIVTLVCMNLYVIDGWLGLGLYGGVFIVTLVFSCWYFYLNLTEKKDLINIFHKLLK